MHDDEMVTHLMILEKVDTFMWKAYKMLLCFSSVQNRHGSKLLATLSVEGQFLTCIYSLCFQ